MEHDDDLNHGSRSRVSSEAFRKAVARYPSEHSDFSSHMCVHTSQHYLIRDMRQHRGFRRWQGSKVFGLETLYMTFVLSMQSPIYSKHSSQSSKEQKLSSTNAHACDIDHVSKRADTAPFTSIWANEHDSKMRVEYEAVRAWSSLNISVTALALRRPPLQCP